MGPTGSRWLLVLQVIAFPVGSIVLLRLPKRVAFFSACVPLLWLAALPCVSQAKDFHVASSDDIANACEQVTAGDTIVLKNGTWNDTKLKFPLLQGTQASPIVIRAQTAGEVIFTGRSEFRFSGSYVTVSGFVFRDIHDISDIVQMRTHSQRLASHCRITDCHFEQTPDAKGGSECRWLSMYGTHNRVDHCFFAGKRSKGTTLVVWVVDSPQHHRIDHNHFGPRPPLGRNGGETIRIGTSEVSECSSQTTVEANYFQQCDGEAETISNKSCDNLYRDNFFDRCSGSLTLRHGHRCTVTRNAFVGQKARGTGGVRIIGRQHRVNDNYFEGLRGDSERAALCIMNGVPDGPLNGYAPVVGAIVSRNTFVDCKVTLDIGLSGSSKQSAPPRDCVIKDNLFAAGKWSLSRTHTQPVGFRWENNISQPNRSKEPLPSEVQVRDFPLSRSGDSLLRPTDPALQNLGTPKWPDFAWPTAETTGPSF